MSGTENDTSPLPADPRLILVAGGDAAAFRELFDEYWDNIYGVALVLTKSEAIAEDMTQDVFMKVWTKRADLPGIERFGDWLFIIARNHIFSELQKLKVRSSYTDQLVKYFASNQESGEPTPDELLLAKESGRLIGDAVSRLPQQQKEIYRLTREEGMTHQAIAEKLGISRHTVRNHMAAALKNIRDYLENRTDGLLLLVCLLEAFL